MSISDATTVQNFTPSEAWKKLEEDKTAVLIDVRSKPEWSFVGVPDLSDLGKAVIMIEWRAFPDMQVNTHFADAVLSNVDDIPETMLFICRSGARSLDAARYMSVAFANMGKPVTCINVDEGFEGDLDTTRHRGSINGWKSAGLPWQQS